MDKFPTPEDDHKALRDEPRYWYNKAADLHAAAGALWYCMEHPDTAAIADSLGLGQTFSMTAATWRVYRMLCGMALELGYKAIAVAQGKSVVTSHDLVKLADHAAVPITSRADRNILELLTGCIVWDGKYPVPKTSRVLESFVHTSYDTLYRKEISGTLTVLKPLQPNPLDWQEYQRFWSQVVAIFEWEAGDQPQF